MPLIYQPIPEITTHILDPITEQLVFRIIKRCNLTDVFKENIFIKPGYTNVSETSDFENKTLLNRNLFKCDVTYQMNPLATKWPMLSQEHLTHYGISTIFEQRRYPIFYDQFSLIRLYEIGNPKSMSLNCTMTFLNRETAYSTIEAITSIYGNGDEIYHTNFMFDFPIPEKILVPLFRLYQLQNHERSFKEYLEYYADKNYGVFGLLENKENRSNELIIRRNNIYTIYQLEFQDEKPTEDAKEQSIERYNINFQVITQFNCPSKLFLQYPVIINNQDLPSDLIPKHISSPYRGTDGKHTQPAIENMREDKEDSFININNAIGENFRFPFYDDWQILNNVLLYKFNYIPFFISAFTLDTNKEYTELVINDVLDEESNIQLIPEIIKILIFQKYVSFRYSSLINVSIFANDKLIDSSMSEITDEGNIITRVINKRKVYHVVLSLAPSTVVLDGDLDWNLLFQDEYYQNFFISILDMQPQYVYDRNKTDYYTEYLANNITSNNPHNPYHPNNPNNPNSEKYKNDPYDPDNPNRIIKLLDPNTANNIHDQSNYIVQYGDINYGVNKTFRVFDFRSFYCTIIPTRESSR
jgi:hypothetical protein